MPISLGDPRRTESSERKPKKRRAKKPKKSQSQGGKIEGTPLEDISATSSDADDDDANTDIDGSCKCKWRCIAFVLFIVGLLCGSLFVGIIVRLSFNKKVDDAHKSLAVCEGDFQACRYSVHRYSNVYGPVDIQNGCKNYVYHQCEVVKNSTIECHDLNIHMDGDEACVRTNNETITCGDVLTMATNCS
ncbi:uncharacterized protein [Ptychodera flava]|uniref:uncharacterized protein n=1 Tax=Ptychodera flava TaxID=63121 RepID=UPI003969EFA3